MEQPKVSVVIPVYNAADYLEECIQSLLTQSLQQCEFIFVNDGSSDHSQQLIEAYQEKDYRIKLLNQENHGVSYARNKGVEIAKGEYIGFIDADDTITENTYQHVYQLANQFDSEVVIFHLVEEVNGIQRVISYPFPRRVKLHKKDIHEFIIPHMLQKEDFNSVCNKLYRRETLNKLRLQFPINEVLGEDGQFNWSFFLCANSAIYSDFPGYYYREVAGSATRNLQEKDYFSHALRSYQRSIPGRIEMSSPQIKTLKAMKLLHQVLAYIHIYILPTNELSKKERRQYVQTMIHHPVVQEALRLYPVEKVRMLGRYDRFLMKCIKHQSLLGLYSATAYSRWRNRKKGEVHS
ncbi:glycosyltransferase family 2 protein [Cytobacillus kochii]|uniref:glycosyltransferase family 2 protein n=1 Tax=Cytobacillus kochii TaxID=859143 RepID=UPI0012FDF85B|nr:glycosyltransferase family 2 protein [Cytobacillus kochii]